MVFCYSRPHGQRQGKSGDRPGVSGSKAQGVDEANFLLGRKWEALPVGTTCSDSRKQSHWQASADIEHRGGLAPVFLMGCFQDGYEVLEGWAK